ncbi:MULTISPECIES: hypothetical protein [Colwellia]|uniref:Uncharacterized protein n=1 Tax=Colwellia marinimaniae TaxID=1513592 RepID=A0ABQ0MVN9_9GAMM|nr:MULTISPECIES: hypothetical protein [Colwellia]GAW96407.1 hypothetical protein MTCD1_02021 [Colwellia marinimaniae]
MVIIEVNEIFLGLNYLLAQMKQYQGSTLTVDAMQRFSYCLSQS